MKTKNHSVMHDCLRAFSAVLTAIVIAFFMSGCQNEPIGGTPSSKAKEKQLPNEYDSDERIHAWEAPFNLTDSDIPSNVVSKLQDAIDYAAQNNKELIIEKGVYTIDSTITFPSGVDVDFSGAEFI